MTERERQTTDKASASRVRNRILHCASQLFIHQGYHRTTLRKVLAEAGVSEAEFGRHFASIDDLHWAFLEASDANEVAEIQAFIDERSAPLTRFMGVIEALRPWMVERNFRGCIFINAISEFPDPESPPRVMGVTHYDRLRQIILDLTQALKESEPDKYAHLNIEQVADEYMVIITGTITMGSLYSSDHTMAAALRGVRRLLRPAP